MAANIEAPSTLTRPRTLTEEQEQIIDYVPPDGQKVMINAFAGCAKTTILREIVKHWGAVLQSGMSVHHNQRANKRFLYLVFNRDAEIAAKNAFYQEDNNAALVHVRTHHSLALKFYIEMLRYKVKTNQAVGAGVKRALEQIDRKLADLQGKQYTPQAYDDEIMALDDDDGPPPDNEDGDEENDRHIDTEGAHVPRLSSNRSDDFFYDGLAEEGVSAVGAAALGHSLPLDLESDQVKPFDLDRGDNALRVLDEFCRDRTDNSEGFDEPGAKHVAKFVDTDRDPTLPLSQMQQQVLVRAQKAWRTAITGRVNPKNGRLVISHEVTLKLFCSYREQSEAFLKQQYHTVLFDEAQDIDEILMAWIERTQGFVVYLVGDAFQSIYNFKGARNAMAYLTSNAASARPDSLRMFYLSQSFRFGPEISKVANSVLEISGRFQSLQCMARLTSAPGVPHTAIKTVTSSLSEGDQRLRAQREITRHEKTADHLSTLCRASAEPVNMTVIARKNSTLLTLAIELASENIFVTLSPKLMEKLHYGAYALSRYGDMNAVEVRIKGLTPMVKFGRRNVTIRPLHGSGEPTYSHFTSQVSDQLQVELQILELARHMGDLNKVKTALGQFLKYHEASITDTEDGRRSHIIVTTVHGAKGGEWNSVTIMDDFPDLCTFSCALRWLQGPRASLYSARPTTPFTGDERRQLLQSLKNFVATKVFNSDERKDGLRCIENTLKHAKTFESFVTSLSEEVNLYYVTLTRAKEELYMGTMMERFISEVGRALRSE